MFSITQPTYQTVKPLKGHKKSKSSLTGIFAHVRHALLPLFLAFLWIPMLPCRNDKSKNVCFIISLCYNQLDATNSILMSQCGCKMFEFANYILYFLTT